VRILKTNINTNSPAYRENYKLMSKEVDRLKEELEKARQGGAPKYHERLVAKGKLEARERIELLLDRDSPFLELMPLAGHSQSGGTLGGAMIIGLGVVGGVECMISSSEPTFKGGAIGKTAITKLERADQIIMANRLPMVVLNESGGAELPQQADVFVPGGGMFRSPTLRSKDKVPQVCLVFGNSTAGGAYLPGMSDYVVMVKNQAKVFLGGPPLVKMATNEISDAESLGGADMHSRVSGVSDYLAADEYDAIRLGREIMARLNWQKKGDHVRKKYVEPPLYDPDEILGIASADIKVPFDQREIIARVVDGSRFSEFKPLYGNTLITGWAHIHGYQVGILANNGIFFSEAAQKGAQFIQLCNQSNVPIIFLHNITGFIVGRKYEETGIIKNGAKLINAISNSTTPAITIMTGASYGAGNYGMSGRSYHPRYLFTWPNHRIAVMGPDQLAGVLDIVKRDAAENEGRTLSEDEEKQLEMMKGMIKMQITKESDPYFATGRVWDDGIVDPRQTRDVLGICLSSIHTHEVVGTTSWGVFRH
jgi:acyl-CoA carboxylase subunit beta